MSLLACHATWICKDGEHRNAFVQHGKGGSRGYWVITDAEKGEMDCYYEHPCCATDFEEQPMCYDERVESC